jgi:hypothetical protein
MDLLRNHPLKMKFSVERDPVRPALGLMAEPSSREQRLVHVIRGVEVSRQGVTVAIRLAAA